jgi:(1->4)-alpha-D-glucan 1-alpha-D-glucosylmutase
MAPRATYRLQLTPSFTFRDAAAVVPYLADLGVSHLYLSPIEQPRSGSTHGYDVVDHGRLNEELGGRAGFQQLEDSLREHGLRLLLDIVPNHMALDVPGNERWTDVLRHGRRSRFADHFDIDWSPPEDELANRILLPVLADHYGRVLEAGDLQLERRDGGLWVTYADLRFPVDPASAGDLSDVAVAAINRDADALDALLDRQHYRLAYWKLGSYEVDYRRFFDIDTLIGMRVERPDVFDDVHRLVLDLLDAPDGLVDGVRVDHVDGLRAPLAYLDRLRARAPQAWLLVEKILEGDEELPARWPVDGTTGYEFASRAIGLFVDPASEAALTVLTREIAGVDDWDELVRIGKLGVLHQTLAADIDRLANAFVAVCARHRRYRDFAREELREALRETLASFPVYRTYATESTIDPTDAHVVADAIADAAPRRPDLDAELFAFLGRILAIDPAFNGPHEAELRLRFQQLSAVVMAKGKEDTALYRYPRLLALNDVGSDPGHYGVAPSAFHAANERAATTRPQTLLALSTHDSKRSADVRARLAVLSELPDQWSATVQRWRAHGGKHRSNGVPDPATELFIYQTLVGAHPLPFDRAWTAIEKSIREAKVSTSWTSPDPDYEEAVRAFLDALLRDAWFLAELDDLVARLDDAGRTTALALVLLQLTSPGVPDVYQGTELWDLSLVDPDNRRPVDFALRRALLEEIVASGPAALPRLAKDDDGLHKLLVIARTLAVRTAHPEWFDGTAAYAAPAVEGPDADHVVAYRRGDDVAVVVPRLIARLEGSPPNAAVTLPPGDWRPVFGDGPPASGVVDAASLLRKFPVCLLVRGGADDRAEGVSGRWRRSRSGPR